LADGRARDPPGISVAAQGSRARVGLSRALDDGRGGHHRPELVSDRWTSANPLDPGCEPRVLRAGGDAEGRGKAHHHEGRDVGDPEGTTEGVAVVELTLEVAEAATEGFACGRDAGEA